ncbi:hypothetical protein EVAR_97436_1 [Eumeta japonica]|uniref:Uncharacterized protein n=1 Tax=Eumeta variegata TaxID=151549 RepID=A0A4C1X134_EUMVA|nr:hypothetical protein EVAR_97436_1 [Eumeta japonica]
MYCSRFDFNRGARRDLWDSAPDTSDSPGARRRPDTSPLTTYAGAVSGRGARRLSALTPSRSTFDAGRAAISSSAVAENVLLHVVSLSGPLSHGMSVYGRRAAGSEAAARAGPVL